MKRRLSASCSNEPAQHVIRLELEAMPASIVLISAFLVWAWLSVVNHVKWPIGDSLMLMAY